MGQAVTALTGLDLHVSYIVVSAVRIPLTLYGMTFSSKFQAWTGRRRMPRTPPAGSARPGPPVSLGMPAMAPIGSELSINPEGSQ